MRFTPPLLLSLMTATCGGMAAAQTPSPVTFLIPADSAADGPPVYAIESDPDRISTYESWLDNESARMALDLYSRAMRLARESGRLEEAPRTYFILLTPGGNHAAVGFQLLTDSGVVDHSRTPYMKLGPQEWRFSTTLLHETGHVVLAALAGGRELPRHSIAPIPHTTAALTDRVTAFDEGFAIHLETLAAHTGVERGLRDRYHHGQFLFGEWPGFLAEYYRGSADMLSYAQSLARYHEVRENSFAFAAAFKGPDYLRVQIEKSRDFSTLRDANQLLQSEGFYASFFFGLLLRGKAPPEAEVLRSRQDRTLEALAHMFSTRHPDSEAPYLLHFLESYRELYPDEAAIALDAFLDLSHGVFVDPEAARLWRDHYMAALRLDIEALNREGIEAARSRWRGEATTRPELLYSRLGPQLECQVPGVSVELIAFGSAPLAFDLNTAQEGVLRLIPRLSEASLQRWLDERSREPFHDLVDFENRVGLETIVLNQLECEG